MEENKSQRPWYFALNTDGDSAIVRLLHSSVSTIETQVVHSIKVGGKSKKIKCLGEGCPLCANNNYSSDRIFVHLFDYTDNREKVWDRTNKILPQFEAIEKAWAPLNSAVLKITRKGNEFPTYSIEIQNPANYSGDNLKNMVDTPLAKFYYLNRKLEEVETFVRTGEFPERKPFVPKEEYFKQKKAENTSNMNEKQKVESNAQTSITGNVATFVPIDDDDLPF